MKRYGATYPMVFDAVADTAAPYGVWNTPQTFFVDPRGFIAKHVLGPVSTAGFDQAVRSRLAA